VLLRDWANSSYTVYIDSEVPPISTEKWLYANTPVWVQTPACGWASIETVTYQKDSATASATMPSTDIKYTTTKADNTYLATSFGKFEWRSRTKSDVGVWTVAITSTLQNTPP
jgi:hypothetical protein